MRSRWSIVPDMVSTAVPKSGGIFRWTRVRFTLIVASVFGLLLSINNESPTLAVVARAMIVAMGALFAFGLLEQWPKRLPRKLPRSVLQLLGIVAAIPISAVVAYVVTVGGDPQFSQNTKRMQDSGGSFLPASCSRHGSR